MTTQESRRGETVDLIDVIRGFLSRNKYLHEFRLQKLVYLAELESLKERGSRLTNAEFKPYMYGSYSEDIANALEEIRPNAKTKADMHHGEIVPVYKGPDKDAELDEDIRGIIDEVHHRVKNNKISNEEFGQWTKDSWLYQNTPFGDEMNFNRYLRNKNALHDDLSRLED